jgi:hypothetical protein
MLLEILDTTSICFLKFNPCLGMDRFLHKAAFMFIIAVYLIFLRRYPYLETLSLLMVNGEPAGSRS